MPPKTPIRVAGNTTGLPLPPPTPTKLTTQATLPKPPTSASLKSQGTTLGDRKALPIPPVTSRMQTAIADKLAKSTPDIVDRRASVA